jgi:uncharacterized membrane protein
MRNLSFKMNWISVVMLLSLALNFFAIGFLYAGHKAKEIRMTRLSFDNSISKIVEPFPRSGKREFYVTMKSKRSDLIPIYREIMAQRGAIMDIIAEEQFDPEKFRLAMEEYRNKYHSMVVESQNVMIQVLEKLSLEERTAILERYKNPPERSYRRRGDDRRRDVDRRRMSEGSENSGGQRGF